MASIFIEDQIKEAGLDPDMKLSQYFRLEEFLKTGATWQGIRNIPESYHIENMKDFCAKLDILRQKYGPINVESGFRSQETNNYLSGGSVQVSATSLHMQGLAADITFSKIKAHEVVADLLADPNLASNFGEIAIKKSYLHISAPYPPKKVAYFMYVNNYNQYIKMTSQDKTNFIARHTSVFPSLPSIPGVPEGISKTLLLLALLGTGGTLLYMYKDNLIKRFT